MEIIGINILFYIVGTTIGYIILYFINSKLKLQRYIINKKRKNIVLAISIILYLLGVIFCYKIKIGMTVQGDILNGVLFGGLLFLVSFLQCAKIKK